MNPVDRIIVTFRDGDATSLHACHQRAHPGRRCGRKADLPERRRRFEAPDPLQRQVEPSCVADNDRAVRIGLSGGRVKAE